MKNTSILKLTTSFALLSIVTVSLTSFLVDRNHEKSTKKSSQQFYPIQYKNADKDDDAQFLIDAAKINLQEILLGQLAQEKGEETCVKELGKMMESGHTKAQKDLIALAKSKSITIPTFLDDKGRKEYDELKSLSIVDFDKSYVSAMIKGHENAIDLYHKIMNDGSDSDITTWASKIIPDLENHLKHSKACKVECEKK